MIKRLAFIFLFFAPSYYSSFGQQLPLSKKETSHPPVRDTKVSGVSENTIPQEEKIFLNTSRSSRTSAAASISGTVTDAFCFGSSDGSIVYTLSGGKLPYSYQWNNGLSGTVYGDCWNIITLTNPGTETLSDYQVRINFPYQAGMNSDFSDLRFSDTTNTSLYAYWIESYQDGVSAVFWVKVPSIPPGNSFLRASYCDPSAVSLSNGTNTFEYFEDFDNQDISAWTHVCEDLDQVDETCELDVISLMAGGYGVRLRSYAHCNGLPINGVKNSLRKNISIPAGQYKIDVATYFRVCLRAPLCADSARIYSRLRINGNNASAYFLMRENPCGCNTSFPTWIQIRSNPFNTSTTSNEYSLSTEVSTCGNGEIVYNDYRIRKFVLDPGVTIGAQQNLLYLNNLRAGNYTITVTDNEGSISTSTFTVNQLPAPLVNDISLCGKDIFSLSVSGPYASFNWYASPTGGSLLETTNTYTTDSLSQNTTFYVSGTGTNGCQSSPRTAVQAFVLLPDKHNGCLNIFSGISPNGDGLNDEWFIEGIEKYPLNKLYIFDRWGTMVFERLNYNNSPEKIWKGKSNKGTFKEQELPNGTYFYELEIDGLSKPLSGFVIINREK